MGVIISLQRDSAARDVSRHRFRKSKSISKTFLGENLIISFEIRSYPSDLLVFVLPTSSGNSMIVRGEFHMVVEVAYHDWVWCYPSCLHYSVLKSG